MKLLSKKKSIFNFQFSIFNFLKYSIFLFFIILFNFCDSTAQENKISIYIKGAENKEILFAYYYEDKYYPVEETKLDENGKIELLFEEKLEPGIYLVMIRDAGFFDLIIPPDAQNFEVKTDIDNYVLNMVIEGSPDNENFYNYLRKSTEIQEQTSTKEEKNAKLTELWNSEIENYKGTFFGTLLKAMHVFEVPYSQFYDYIDFSQEGLLKTPFLKNIIYYHISTHLDKSPEEIIKQNNKLLQKTQANQKVFEYVSMNLLYFYRETCKIGINEVFINLSENYFLSEKGNWLDTNAVRIIRKTTETFKFSTIGHEAYNFKVQTIKQDSISLFDIKAAHIMLFFWNTDCDHCHDVAEVFKENYKTIKKKNYEILGINIDSKNVEQWSNFVETKKYKWLNGIDIKDNYKIREYYYVCSTPMLYIIDNNHKIINILYGEDEIINFIHDL